MTTKAACETGSQVCHSPLPTNKNSPTARPRNRKISRPSCLVYIVNIFLYNLQWFLFENEVLLQNLT